jgi:hypothetical protein
LRFDLEKDNSDALAIRFFQQTECLVFFPQECREPCGVGLKSGNAALESGRARVSLVPLSTAKYSGFSRWGSLLLHENGINPPRTDTLFNFARDRLGPRLERSIR